MKYKYIFQVIRNLYNVEHTQNNVGIIHANIFVNSKTNWN